MYYSNIYKCTGVNMFNQSTILKLMYVRLIAKPQDDAWWAMILSAIPGKVSSITSISPKSSDRDSFSHTEQYAPLNLCNTSVSNSHWKLMTSRMRHIPSLPCRRDIPHMCRRKPRRLPIIFRLQLLQQGAISLQVRLTDTDVITREQILRW